jgi:hypothetical protein
VGKLWFFTTTSPIKHEPFSKFFLGHPKPLSWI